MSTFFGGGPHNTFFTDSFGGEQKNVLQMCPVDQVTFACTAVQRRLHSSPLNATQTKASGSDHNAMLAAFVSDMPAAASQTALLSKQTLNQAPLVTLSTCVFSFVVLLSQQQVLLNSSSSSSSHACQRQQQHSYPPSLRRQHTTKPP